MLKKIESLFAFTVLMLFSWLIPKKKNFILFFPIHYRNSPFSGNLRALFEYCATQRPELEIACINLTAKELERYPQFSGKFFLGRYTLRNLWLLLRAEKIVIDSGTNFPGRFRLYQLWHGTGFKNIGQLHTRNSLTEKVKIYFLSKQLRLVVATSEADRERKLKSFATEHVYVTGSPRNDFLLDPAVDEAKVRAELGVPQSGKLISYLPTFRDTKIFNPFSTQFYFELNQWLAAKGAYFVIKKHPNDKEFKLPQAYSHIIDLGDTGLDTQLLLRVSAMVVSDYSGVISDFALLDRPILLYCHDYEDYLKTCREFYYNPLELLDTPASFNEKELLAAIQQHLEHPVAGQNSRFLKKFHKYVDNKSSQRVLSFILED